MQIITLQIFSLGVLYSVEIFDLEEAIYKGIYEMGHVK